MKVITNWKRTSIALRGSSLQFQEGIKGNVNKCGLVGCLARTSDCLSRICLYYHRYLELCFCP